MTERVINNEEKEEDQEFDLSLRPKRIKEFIGQDKVKENLGIFMDAAKKREEALEHVLLHGPPGIGKTTLAHIIGSEMGVNVRVTSGPAIEKAGDLGAILTNLEDGDILFIDEIHRLNRLIEEVLYPAMEDYVLDIVVGKGPSARTLRLDLPKFTLVGATTKVHLLSSPMRDRFGNTFRLDFYHDDDIEKILQRSARILKVDVDKDALPEIAKRSRRTPRVANRLLKRVRDYTEVKADGKVSPSIAIDALTSLDIDHQGLDETDRKILNIIIDKFGGGPVGLNTIAAAISEDQSTLEDVYEPYLMQIGLLARTPRGRVVTEDGYKHVGKEVPEDLQQKLV
ncbi:MAG: Holliday junction branch migration DNA helicase RuvB [bacterium]|nr:Holliday junction branch migration DNA helicase RuvB [bacterium]